MIIATHWTLIIWVEIKTLQVLQQAKKAPDAWSQHETTHTKKKQPRKSNKFELLFIHVMMTGSLVLVLYPVLYDLNKLSFTLYGYFYTRPVCFYQILQAMPVKPRPLWSVRNIPTPQRFLAMNDTLILLHHNKCFLSNSVKPTRVL